MDRSLIEIENLIVPANAAATLARYIIYHLKPGSFTEAVLLNRLYEAVTKADLSSMRYLGNIVKLTYHYCPTSLTLEPGYFRWLENKDRGWHDEIQKRYGKWWQPYLN